MHKSDDTPPINDPLAGFRTPSPDDYICRWSEVKRPRTTERDRPYTLRALKFEAKTRNVSAGSILVLQGFSEFCEKYFELFKECADAGFTVFSFDWRGQGGSSRYLKHLRERPYSLGFHNDILDARAVVDHFENRGDITEPLYLIAHSMGGHMGLRLLHDHPDMFKAASLSSPMVGLSLPAPWWVMRIVLMGLNLLGRGAYEALSGGNWSDKNGALDEDPRSRDPVRRLIQYHYSHENEVLRINNPTYRWAQEALKSMRLTQKKSYLERIKTPTLIGQGGNDFIVDLDAMNEAAKRMPNASILKFEDAYHELFMERDEIRAPFIAETLSFFGKNR